jgi:hypothetical protein
MIKKILLGALFIYITLSAVFYISVYYEFRKKFDEKAMYLYYDSGFFPSEMPVIRCSDTIFSIRPDKIISTFIIKRYLYTSSAPVPIWFGAWEPFQDSKTWRKGRGYYWSFSEWNFLPEEDGRGLRLLINENKCK